MVSNLFLSSSFVHTKEDLEKTVKANYNALVTAHQ